MFQKFKEINMYFLLSFSLLCMAAVVMLVIAASATRGHHVPIESEKTRRYWSAPMRGPYQAMARVETQAVEPKVKAYSEGPEAPIPMPPRAHA
jgi:hypothetical protein